MKEKFLILPVLMLILFSGCRKPVCEDPRSLNYEVDLGNKFPRSDSFDCVFSKAVWFLMDTDKLYAKDDSHGGFFPLYIFLDDVQIGTIDTTVQIGASICDPTLPTNEFVVYQLPDGNAHQWAAKTANATIIYNDTIRANANMTCIPVPM